MPNFDEILDDIRETRKQIMMTKSKRRKYELNRHLHKQLKEYKMAKYYYSQSQRREHDKGANTSGTGR